EQREIIPRHELAGDFFKLAVNPQFRALPGEGGEAVERLRPRAELLETRVRRRAPTRTPRPDILNQVKFFKPLDRQQLQKHRVKQAENRRVRADAERQCEYSDEGEAGVLP